MNARLPVAILALSLAGPAAAVTFDFTGGAGREARTFSWTEDALSLTVSGAVFDSRGVSAYGGLVGHWSSGLGLRTTTRDAHYVDGSGYDELLLFSFSEAVELRSVSFGYADRDDDFVLFADADGDFGRQLDAALAPVGGLATHAFSTAWLGALFGIGAAGSNDEFKIRAISVDLRVEPQAAVVPLPPALALIATALGALALTARRRRA